MATKTAVVTGGTSGLGEAAVVALAKQGYRVLVVGRDAARGDAVVAKARAAGGAAELVVGDLFGVEEVRRVGRELLAKAPSLDLLVNNAGGTFGAKAMTTDGLERTFALNVMAPFVLTETLRPALAAAKGRVVNVVTGVPKKAKATLEQLAGDASSAGMMSYIRAKLALIALTKEQQRRFAAEGITAVCLHPGIIPGTRFGPDMPRFVLAISQVIGRAVGMMSTLDQAAERYVKVGTGQVEGGGFYSQGTLAPAPVQAQDPAFASSLWARLEKVTQARA